MLYKIIQRLATISGFAAALILWMFALPGTAFAYGIDDLVGNKWRIGTFVFLLFGMVLYAFFVVLYMRSAHGTLKKGEYILLVSILGGVLLGFVVSFVQFIDGILL